MKTIKHKFLFLLVSALILIPSSFNKLSAQTVVKIGEAEISVQSPISIKKVEEPVKPGIKSRFPRSFDESYIGFGTALPVDRDQFLPMHYGRINSFELGTKYFYRPGKHYAIGTFAQYTFYNYRLKGAAANETFVPDVPGDVKKEYFRTDNIGTGLVNRFYFFPGSRKPVKLDLGGYVDFSFSKRYNVKTRENGKLKKHKYRDGEMFNPVQCGLYGALSKGSYSVYVRYRLTNLFNPNLVEMELPQLSMGVQISL